MIFDRIENIENYKEIEPKIADFVLTLKENAECGKIFLSSDKLTYANVDSYITKPAKNCKLEAHKKYIDIQFLLDGEEELAFCDIEDLEVSEEYSPERDVMFFSQPDEVLNKVILKIGYFVLLYPHEAHQPQMAYQNLPKTVKKVVVKIPV